MLRPSAFIAVLGLVALFAFACEGVVEEEPLSTPTPEPSPTTMPTAMATATPTPTPAEPMQPVPLGEGAPITEDGTYVVDVTTGQIWRVAQIGGGSSWSPDGKTLMTTRCCVGGDGIDLIDLESGSAVRIFNGDVSNAIWSPDGSQIVFFPVMEPRVLHIINRDGSGLRQLNDLPAGEISWSPNGEHMAFGVWDQSGWHQRLYVYNFKNGEMPKIADSIKGFAWSPLDSILAYADEGGFYIYRPDSGELQQLAVGPSTGSILWSPDGSRIAFRFGPAMPLLQNPEAYVQMPYLIDLQGSAEPQPLPPASWLSWSPDGTHLAYQSYGCITRDWDIYTIHADGSSMARLTYMPDTFKEGPFWSPVGSSLAFSTYDQIMLVDADSGELRTVAVADRSRVLLHMHLSVWSPDGRYLLFGAYGAHGICD